MLVAALRTTRTPADVPLRPASIACTTTAFTPGSSGTTHRRAPARRTAGRPLQVTRMRLLSGTSTRAVTSIVDALVVVPSGGETMAIRGAVTRIVETSNVQAEATGISGV